MPTRLMPIFATADAVEARLVQNLLYEAGIHSYLVHDVLLNGAEQDENAGAAVRVAVARGDVRRARAIVETLQARRARQTASTTSGEAYDALPPAAAWPRCPSCEKPRTAACPYCGTSGVNFPPADDEPGADQGRPALERWLCPICDEPVEGHFLRWCEWCNHDFGAGVALAPPPDAGEINARLVAGCIGLGLFLLALGLYFAVVVR